jgi:hypothetical protein
MMLADEFGNAPEQAAAIGPRRFDEQGDATTTFQERADGRRFHERQLDETAARTSSAPPLIAPSKNLKALIEQNWKTGLDCHIRFVFQAKIRAF